MQVYQKLKETRTEDMLTRMKRKTGQIQFFLLMTFRPEREALQAIDRLTTARMRLNPVTCRMEPEQEAQRSLREIMRMLEQTSRQQDRQRDS